MKKHWKSSDPATHPLAIEMLRRHEKFASSGFSTSGKEASVDARAAAAAQDVSIALHARRGSVSQTDSLLRGVPWAAVQESSPIWKANNQVSISFRALVGETRRQREKVSGWPNRKAKKKIRKVLVGGFAVYAVGVGRLLGSE